MSNKKIRYAIRRVVVEEEADESNITSDAHNITADNFCQTPVTPNTHGEDANVILTSERLNNSDSLEETLKGLTSNDSGYYNSDKNGAEDNPTRDPKVATHTSDGNKRKVTDNSNGNLQQKSLINHNLLTITMTIDPQVLDRVATCGGTPHEHTTPTTKEFITDAARSSACVLRTPGNLSRMGRDGITPWDGNFDVRPPRENGPVLNGVTTVSPTCCIMGIQEILSKHGSTEKLGVSKISTLPLMKIWLRMGILHPFLAR